MLKAYGNLKIFRKMVAAFLVICFVSTSLSSIIISYAFMRNTRRQTDAFARAVNSQVVSNMEHFMASYQGLMRAVLIDTETLSALAGDAVPVTGQAEYRTQINRLLFRLIKMQPSLIYAGILLNNGQSFQTGATGETMDLQRLAEQRWMKRFIESKQSFAVMPMHPASYTNRFGHGLVISAVQKIYSPFRTYAGFVLLDVETESVVNLENESLLKENLEGLWVIVENGEHQILFDSAGGTEGRTDEDGFFLYSEPDQRYVVLSEPVSGGEITVHTVYPKAALILLRRDLILVAAVSVLSCVLLSLLCAMLFSRSFTQPIQRLREAISRAEDGRWTRVEGSFNRDEFGELIGEYNRMAERIEYLIHQVWQRDLQKKDAQLIALRTQINPHMMFNTLESIRMKAVIAGNLEVAEMTSLLGKMFRMTLENVNERHTVRDELDYVSSFLKLQNMRFRAENVLTKEIPEELGELPCPVMLFQPLVENSLSHGSGGQDRPLHILIRGGRTEVPHQIRFLVRDDGTGMDPDRLMAVADRLDAIRQGNFTMDAPEAEGRPHIGLENIAKRLFLRYGEAGALRIVYSNETGTEIEIRMLDSSGEEGAEWTSGS